MMELYKYEPLKIFHVKQEPSNNTEWEQLKEKVLTKIAGNANRHTEDLSAESAYRIKEFRENRLIQQLNNSMEEYIYPRIRQIMHDFGLLVTDTVYSAAISSFCFKSKKNEGLVVEFSPDIWQSKNEVAIDKCPFYKQPNKIQANHSEVSFVARYNEYCRGAIQILEKLERYEIALKETILLAETFGVRFEKKVLIEKVKRKK